MLLCCGVFLFICVDDQSRISVRPPKMMPKISLLSRSARAESTVIQRDALYYTHWTGGTQLIFSLWRAFQKIILFCFYSSVVVVVVVVYFKDASTVREWASTAFSSTPGVSSDRSQWFFGGLFCLSRLATYVCTVSTSLCCGERGGAADDWRSFGDRLFASLYTFKWDISNRVLSASHATHVPDSSSSPDVRIWSIPSACGLFQQQRQSDRAFISISSRVTIIIRRTRENMWWWCKPAPASQPAVGQAKKESYPAQDIYHTPTDWIELDLKTFSHTDMPVTFVYRQEWWNSDEQRETNKIYCDARVLCCRYLVVCSRTRMSKARPRIDVKAPYQGIFCDMATAFYINYSNHHDNIKHWTSREI